MNSTGRWLTRVGALVIVAGFFLPAVAVGCTPLPTLSKSMSFSDLASNSAALYVVPLGALVALGLTFVRAMDRDHRRFLIVGQVAGLAVGALAAIVAVEEVARKVSSYTDLVPFLNQLIGTSPKMGLYALVLGYGLASVGIVMQFTERAEYGSVPPPPGTRESVLRWMRRPTAPRVAAWVITRDGRQHQLFQGATRVGRSSRNDVVLRGDNSVSREHAKIFEENGHFRLVDLGSKAGTCINGQIVRGPTALQPDDEIRFGADTVVRFVAARR